MLNHELIEAFHQGHTIDAHHLFGAHLTNENGVDGIRFTVWAPRAKNVQVVGPFNDWNGEYSFLLPVNDKGIFSLFVPHLGSGHSISIGLSPVMVSGRKKAIPMVSIRRSVRNYLPSRLTLIIITGRMLSISRSVRKTLINRCISMRSI